MEKFDNDGKKWKPGLAAFPGGPIEHAQALWGFQSGGPQELGILGKFGKGGRIWNCWQKMVEMVKYGNSGSAGRPWAGKLVIFTNTPKRKQKRESSHSPNATAYVFLMVTFTTFGHSVQQKRSFRTNSPIPNSCHKLRFLSSYLTVLYLPSIWT